MTAQTSQSHALSTSVGYRSRPDLLLVHLEGEDQRSWLNGQVTGDVRNTSKGDSVYCLAVNVRGRIMADIWVLDLGEHLSLLMPRSASEALLASFESQIIMEDVEVVAAPSTHVISLLGPKAIELAESLSATPVAHHPYFPGDELGDGGAWLLSDDSGDEDILTALKSSASALGGCELTDSGYELHRLQKHVPRYPDDFGLKSYPQEAGLKDRAVAFNKGCYLGQEVVCTLENRGKLARVLCALNADSPLAPGAELRAADDTVLGQVTSVARDENRSKNLALGYVKRAHAKPGDTLLCSNISVAVVAAVGS